MLTGCQFPFTKNVKVCVQYQVRYTLYYNVRFEWSSNVFRMYSQVIGPNEMFPRGKCKSSTSCELKMKLLTYAVIKTDVCKRVSKIPT